MEKDKKEIYAPPLNIPEDIPRDLELVSEANGHTIFKSKSTGKLFVVQFNKIGSMGFYCLSLLN